MARYLVTGGLGFIGNELVRQLKCLGEVFILDNAHRRAEKIEDLTDICVFQTNIADRTATTRAIAIARPDIVFHMAGIHFIPECNAAPDQVLRVNVEGTQNVLDACVGAEVELLVMASTGAVYADSPHRLSEHSPIAPVDIYGWSKLFAEELCRSRAARGELAVIIARLFNSYGPRETNAHIVPEILHQLRLSDELRLGNTTTRRDYTNVVDCAAALIRLSQTPAARNRSVNVASGCDASVGEMVRFISELLNRKVLVALDGERLRPVDKQIQIADLSLLESLLQWKPPIMLKEGLSQLLRFEGFALLSPPANTSLVAGELES